MKLGVVLFLTGLPGIVLVAVFIIPALLRFATEKPTVPLPVIILVTIAQSAVLLALAVWAGASLSSRVGLQAPLFSALVGRIAPPTGLSIPIVSGLAGGVLGGALVFAANRYAPAALAGVQAKLTPPLAVRVFYGGITEELLTRWGLMSLLLWLAWKFLQRGSGLPQPPYVGGAIAVSAVIFGLAHLPITAALVGTLTKSLVAYVVAANAIFGIIAGYLFWRNGLEAAMIAHASAHVLSWIGESLSRAPSV